MPSCPTVSEDFGEKNAGIHAKPLGQLQKRRKNCKKIDYRLSTFSGSPTITTIDYE